MNQGMVAFEIGKFTNTSAHTSYLCVVKEPAPARLRFFSLREKPQEPYGASLSLLDFDPGGVSLPEKIPKKYMPRTKHPAAKTLFGLPRRQIRIQNLNPVLVGPAIIY